MNDLTLALWTAADQATAGRDPMPASPVLSRIRRRRTVRYASQGAVGVAAAGAAVVGGVQVTSRAPEPSPAATDLADAMTIRCGTDLDDLVQPGGAPDATILLDSSEAPAVTAADGNLTLAAVAQTTTDVVPQLGTSITYALFRGRTVVGLPADGWVDDQVGGFQHDGPDAELYRWNDVRFEACQSDGTVAGAVEPGTYGVVAFLVPDEPTDWPIPVRSNGIVVRLGEPAGAEARRPELDSLVISTDGLGALRLGGAPPAAGPTALAEWLGDSCYTLGVDAAASSVSGSWQATYPFRATPLGLNLRPFGLNVEEGTITAVEVVTDGPRTPEGLQVGDSLADARAAYPGLELLGRLPAVDNRPALDVWAGVDGDHVLAFEVATDEPYRARPDLDLAPGTVVTIVAALRSVYADGPVDLPVGCTW